MTERGTPFIDEKSEFQLTRELELLISGALVFALLQAPELLDRWWSRTQPHVAGAGFATSFAAYYVAKLASYGLIAAVSTHFLLRGFWVALLGLRAAFPGGVDEERLELGPFATSFYRDRLLTLTQLEDRVDRVAASLFSFVFLFLFLLCGMALWSAIAGVLAVTISRIAQRPEWLAPVFWILFGLYVVLQTFVGHIDKRSKTRELSPRTERIATRLFVFVYYMSLTFLYAPIFFIFSSRISRKVALTAQIIFLYATVATFAVSVLAKAGIIGLNSYIYFPPTPNIHQLRSSHYENLQSSESSATVPTIQSDVVTEPYLRLFIPYQVRADNERARVLCGDVAPFRSEGLFLRRKGDTTKPAQSAAVLECLTRLYTVTLDGKPVSQRDAIFYVHPVSGVHGRLLLIPARGLAPGRHLLIVRRTPVAALDTRRAPPEYFLHFWR